MTTTARSYPAAERSAAQTGYPPGSLAFDWTFAALSALFLAGLWVDGWAHYHGQVDESFFTPWHFLFYGAFTIVGLFTAFHQLRNVSKGYSFIRALPKGYWLSLIGVVTFALGGVGDLIWHTLFGVEAGTEALLSPTHLMLATGMALIFTGPVRSIWNRARDNGALTGWRPLAPMLVGMTLLLALLMFFSAYANGLVLPLAFDGVLVVNDTVQIEQLYIMNADGTRQTRLTDGDMVGASWGAFSPDGSRIAYTLETERAMLTEDESEDLIEADLYLMDADGGNRTQITNAPGLEYGASWSPDGSRLIYVSQSDDAQDLYSIDANGGEPVQLTDTPEYEWVADWSPDGTQIVYSVADGNSQNLWIANPDGTNAVAITTNANYWMPRWSPDGSRILTNGYIDGIMGLYTINPDGSDGTLVLGNEEQYADWSPDGESIVYSSFENGYGELLTAPVTGDTEPTNISQNTALTIRLASFSPDGEQILFSGNGASGGGEEIAPLIQDYGVTGVLIQSALMVGVVTLLMTRWTLPFGAITLVLTVSTALLTILADLYFFIPGALITGLIVDVLIRRLKPSQNRGGLLVLSFLTPALYFACYFITVLIGGGIGWSIHVWTGSIFLAGVTGLFAALLISAATDAPTTNRAAVSP